MTDVSRHGSTSSFLHSLFTFQLGSQAQSTRSLGFVGTSLPKRRTTGHEPDRTSVATPTRSATCPSQSANTATSPVPTNHPSVKQAPFPFYDDFKRENGLITFPDFDSAKAPSGSIMEGGLTETPESLEGDNSMSGFVLPDDVSTLIPETDTPTVTEVSTQTAPLCPRTAVPTYFEFPDFDELSRQGKMVRGGMCAISAC
jgi:hypothetical protein